MILTTTMTTTMMMMMTMMGLSLKECGCYRCRRDVGGEWCWVDFCLA
jgi:hypothetical protein